MKWSKVEKKEKERERGDGIRVWRSMIGSV